jgi:hypothetical protein
MNGGRIAGAKILGSETALGLTAPLLQTHFVKVRMKCASTRTLKYNYEPGINQVLN